MRQALDEAVAHPHRQPGYWRDRLQNRQATMPLSWNESQGSYERKLV